MEQVSRDLRKFKDIIQKKKTLSSRDWELHDSLLETYIRLKRRPVKSVLTIPARTQVTVTLKSYCLDPRKAPPAGDEVFQWRKADGKKSIYLSQLLKLSIAGKYSQKDLQDIIWNLKNETVWEEYPDSYKKILESIDPQASLHLPSKLKSDVKDEVLRKLEDQLPTSARKALDFVKGPYHSYQDFKESLEDRESTQELPKDVLASIEGTELLTENDSHGFTEQDVVFYNPSDDEQTLDLSEYYQEPFRKDVQPMAGYFGDSEALDKLYDSLEALLFEDMLRLGLGFTPVLGDLIDLFEASTGRDFFNNDLLTSEQRFMSAMGILAGSGQSYRYAKKVYYGPDSYIRETEKKYRLIKNQESYKSLDDLSKAAQGKGIPDEWRVKVSKPGKGDVQGIEFVHPENDQMRVRVIPGNPKSPYIESRKPYVKVQKDGKTYSRDGRPLEMDQGPESHIPLDDFDFLKLPWSKK